jgi:hypothetical protein
VAVRAGIGERHSRRSILEEVRKLVLKLVLITGTVVALGGCGAIYSWDTMQLQSARKQAAQTLLAACKSGDRAACGEVVRGGELQ